MKLKGSQRKYLRSLAHHLNPQVIVGKNKLSDSTINFINESLDIHELIKIRFNDNKFKNISKESLEELTNSDIVGDIGKILILYRYQEDDELRKIQLPS